MPVYSGLGLGPGPPESLQTSCHMVLGCMEHGGAPNDESEGKGEIGSSVSEIQQLRMASSLVATMNQERFEQLAASMKQLLPDDFSAWPFEQQIAAIQHALELQIKGCAAVLSA